MPVRLKDSLKQQTNQMQHAEWLGNSTSLVLVHENDIYLRQSPADEEDIRLTSTGVPGLIYNGVTDWLYQGMHNEKSQAQEEFSFKINFSSHAEEILKSQKAMWSSIDGYFFLYATFNDSNVGQMNFPWFSSNTLLRSGENVCLKVDILHFSSHTYTHTGGLTSKGTFPDSLNVRYPTPGTLNPEVTLWLLDLTNITDVQKYQLKEPISLEGQ
jgi:inactive dipeptidyl peptidase 10